MQPPTPSQHGPSFIPLIAPPRSRQVSASSVKSNPSIWAPQPQSPGGVTWPVEVASFLQPAQADNTQSQACATYPVVDSSLGALTKEDVFGPLGIPETSPTRNVGAIGDGRSKEVLSAQDDHVEQLLRVLNLNSPPPLDKAQDSPLSVDVSVSPSTSTSFPTTPLDSAPVTPNISSDFFFKPSYDFGPPIGTRRSSLPEFEPQKNAQHELVWKDITYSSPPSHQYRGPPSSPFPFFEPPSESQSPVNSTQPLPVDFGPITQMQGQQFARPFAERPPSPIAADMRFRCVQEPVFNPSRRPMGDSITPSNSFSNRASPPFSQYAPIQTSHEPINFLSLLHPSSTPPYALFVARVVKSSDQQASIFLQQKLKVADSKERGKIVDAICTRGYEMMAHRFGNWAVQRCLEAASSAEERRKIAACMRGRVVDLASNCYGCHVLQKALDCEEDIRLLIVSELLLGDPAQTLVNKHASHVWSKIMEISWTSPAPPIFAYVNKALQGQWASLACHETGSLVVQHAFENLEEAAKDGIVDELLNQGPAVFGDVVKNQWGAYCIQHILEHGSAKHRELAISHILFGLLEYANNEQGYKSVAKALKEGGDEVTTRFVKRMCEPPEGGRRAIIVDLALSGTGSQLIATVLPSVDKERRVQLYDALRGHVVTLRGCKTGSKVIWLFDRMRAFYGN